MKFTDLVKSLEVRIKSIDITNNRQETLDKIIMLKSEVKRVLDEINNLPLPEQIKLQRLRMCRIPEFSINLYDTAYAWSVIHSPVELSVNELPKICFKQPIAIGSEMRPSDYGIPPITGLSDFGTPPDILPPEDPTPPDEGSDVGEDEKDINPITGEEDTVKISDLERYSEGEYAVVVTKEVDEIKTVEIQPEDLKDSYTVIEAPAEVIKQLYPDIEIPEGYSTVRIAVPLADGMKTLVNTRALNPEYGAFEVNGKIYVYDKSTGNVILEVPKSLTDEELRKIGRSSNRVRVNIPKKGVSVRLGGGELWYFDSGFTASMALSKFFINQTQECFSFNSEYYTVKCYNVLQGAVNYLKDGYTVVIKPGWICVKEALIGRAGDFLTWFFSISLGKSVVDFWNSIGLDMSYDEFMRKIKDMVNTVSYCPVIKIECPIIVLSNDEVDIWKLMAEDLGVQYIK